MKMNHHPHIHLGMTVVCTETEDTDFYRVGEMFETFLIGRTNLIYLRSMEPGRYTSLNGMYGKFEPVTLGVADYGELL